MPKTTIRDVARLAGVSVATVSRVLNESPSVSAATRQRVLEAIRTLNYAPNTIARRLSLGRTHTIAVVVPLFTLPSFVERLRGVQSALSSTGYDLVLFNVDTPAQRDEYFFNLATQSRVDGILILSIPPSDQAAERFLEAHVPTVLVDAYHPALCSVYIDDVEGGYRATRHLIELHHTRIAYLSEYLQTPLEFGPMKNRLKGYQRAHEETDLPIHPEYVIEGERGREAAYHMAKQLLSLPRPPTAIFAASDTQAIGVLDAARELGVAVPDQLSVIGYDDIRDAAYLNLSTIHQPLYETGNIGARLLLSIIENDAILSLPAHKQLPIELVRRQTTAIAPDL